LGWKIRFYDVIDLPRSISAATNFNLNFLRRNEPRWKSFFRARETEGKLTIRFGPHSEFCLNW